MKEGAKIKASWALFRGAILRNLPTLGVNDPKRFYRAARKTYKAEMKRLPDYGENDVLKINLAHAVMLGAIYEHCDPKPDVDALTKFYHDFMTAPKLIRKALAKRDMLSPANVQRQRATGERSQKATHPFTWQFEVSVEDEDRFTATFTRCGIYDYLKSRGMAHIVPAICAMDYTFGECGNHLFLRDTTIATGGKVCDCHYVRRSAATEAEFAKSAADKRDEAARGRDLKMKDGVKHDT